MNLCTNSAHTMRETGGILEIGLDEVSVAGDIDQGDRLKPGKYLKISVIDNGHGISPEIQDRIFEPFFTTKPRGEGTGMGLAVIHGLISDMDGTITVTRGLDQGAAFHVFLPMLEGEQKDTLDEPVSAPKEGCARILFVDDEDGFRQSGKEILEQLGYLVVTATNGLEAHEIFRTASESFDLVITDMAMPKMTGLELVKKIRKENDVIPVILCTGYKDGINGDLQQSIGLCDILLKPILARELTESIPRALEKKAT